MANFEFYYENIINTTSQITPSVGGTSSVSNIYNRKTDVVWGSGDNSDATTSSIQISFTQTTPVSNVVIQNTNFKSFKVYYNSNTANTFTLVNGDTTVSDFVSNSNTNLFLQFATISCINVSIVGTLTMVANAEKQIGQLWILNKIHTFSYNPNNSGYKALLDRHEYEHKMSDGGSVTYVIQDNFKASLKNAYIEQSEYDTFKEIYQLWEPVTFCPFPTGSSWDNDIFEVNWIGNLSKQFSSNYTDNGYNISFDLRETPK